ncbi:MAG TPA: diaminopimelate epimerase [Mycobacteriales bacterium]|nr:diaminopimelate epimerase [Mycobacteriales bacterium]
MRYLKGHGTGNDFVLLPEDTRLDLTPGLVRALCDRRAGVGADGVLRVVRGGCHDEGGWFMDYRNADGSTAEMCGNGMRVFARYLVDAGLVAPGEFTVGTRGGPKRVCLGAAGDVTVDMGAPELLDASTAVGGVPGVAVSMGNPHVVVPVASEAELAGLDLTGPPEVTGGLPDGQNVEFVLRRGSRALALRVHERGVGETRSCGTGVCAAVAATASSAGGEGPGEPWTVDVPGGRLTVRWHCPAGSVLLTGPAVLVATGELRPDWLASLG